MKHSVYMGEGIYTFYKNILIIKNSLRAFGMKFCFSFCSKVPPLYVCVGLYYLCYTNCTRGSFEGFFEKVTFDRIFHNAAFPNITRRIIIYAHMYYSLLMIF